MTQPQPSRLLPIGSELFRFPRQAAALSADGSCWRWSCFEQHDDGVLIRSANTYLCRMAASSASFFRARAAPAGSGRTVQLGPTSFVPIPKGPVGIQENLPGVSLAVVDDDSQGAVWMTKRLLPLAGKSKSIPPCRHGKLSPASSTGTSGTGVDLLHRQLAHHSRSLALSHASSPDNKLLRGQMRLTINPSTIVHEIHKP